MGTWTWHPQPDGSWEAYWVDAAAANPVPGAVRARPDDIGWPTWEVAPPFEAAWLRALEAAWRRGPADRWRSRRCQWAATGAVARQQWGPFGVEREAQAPHFVVDIVHSVRYAHAIILKKRWHTVAMAEGDGQVRRGLEVQAEVKRRFWGREAGKTQNEGTLRKITDQVLRLNLDPEDFTIQTFNGEDEVYLRARGRYKLARRQGWKGNRLQVLSANWTEWQFLVKSIVTTADGATFEADGYADKTSVTSRVLKRGVGAIYAVAQTRSLVRALALAFPDTEGLLDEDEDDVDAVVPPAAASDGLGPTGGREALYAYLRDTLRWDADQIEQWSAKARVRLGVTRLSDADAAMLLAELQATEPGAGDESDDMPVPPDTDPI